VGEVAIIAVGTLWHAWDFGACGYETRIKKCRITQEVNRHSGVKNIC